MSKEHFAPISGLVATSDGLSHAAENEFAQPQRIKIISMGNLSVGKSCMIKRFCEEKFVNKYISTIGIDYGVKSLLMSNREVRVNFWDFSGQDEFLQVRNEFYKDAQGVILVFDVTSRPSFEALDRWIEEAIRFGIERFTCIVCGNKIDKMHRVVSEEEGKLFAKSKGWEYYETSACTGVNIHGAFMSLFQQVISVN
uniref:TPA_exp: Rbjlike protein putative n=1 Tax=Albugo laibachii Nc14 TaxID=890382 RepID=F0WMM6_9STRA|nr:Rbjlike protein putative [Albugo laibachii Nc14]|eukprot:CCA22559.1 Rbjlike protein putative [Albugo laibachii Nc14]